jgi:hypothetical protein
MCVCVCVCVCIIIYIYIYIILYIYIYNTISLLNIGDLEPPGNDAGAGSIRAQTSRRRYSGYPRPRVECVL